MPAQSLHKPLRVLRAAALLAAAVAAIVLAHAPTASAYSHRCTGRGSGCAYFYRTGDTFNVCDKRRDGLSVTVVYYVHGRPHTATNYFGRGLYNGYDGCRKIVRNGPEGTQVVWKVCLANHGRPGGTPMYVIPYTCSSLVWTEHF